MNGKHFKKCDICGRKFEESNDLNVLIVTGPAKCPYCKEIIELRELIQKYDDQHKSATWDNHVHQKNMIPDGNPVNNEFGIKVQTFTLDKYTKEYQILNRTKYINDLIERIVYIREFLLTRVGPQFKILDSIYEDKDLFWKEGGNLVYYVNDATLQYVVIKLKELLLNNSRYSIPKIKNLISSRQKQIFEEQEIFEIYKFEHSGDVMHEKYEPFPIIEYLNKMDKVFDSYKEILNAIADIRDNEYAHIGKVKSEDSLKKINYCGLKRVFNSLNVIYDGFLFSIAPDKFANLCMDYNIWFNQLNREVDFWIRSVREKHKNKN